MTATRQRADISAPDRGRDLANRVIIVTGGASGLGRAIAEHCAAAGARIAVTSRASGRARDAAAKLDGPALGLRLDKPTSHAVHEVIAHVLEQWGRVDGLVNNSGAAIDHYITRVSDADWEASLEANLTGAFRLLRGVVPVMKAAGTGSVVNMISWSGLRGNSGQSAYAAAKAGLVGLTRTAAKELGQFGIRVNAVAPSVYPTGMTSRLLASDRAAALARRPLPREGLPLEVAEAVLFLLSDRSSYTTGQILHVDGGLHLG